MSKTILYYTDSTGFGGAEQALVYLLAGLDRRQWRPVLLHHAGPGLAPLLDRVRKVEVETWATPPLPLGWHGAQGVPRFAQEVRRHQPAIFHAHLTWPLACKYGLLGAILARTPAVVATVQLYVDAPYNWLARRQLRLLSHGVGRYIAVSRALARHLQQTFALPAAKIDVIHNAIDLAPVTQPNPEALRAALGGADQRPVVVTVARLEEQKGHEHLLRAAALLPEARFALVGDGTLRAHLEAYAADLGLTDRVFFLGQRADVADLLAGCDLFVLPSLYEGLPLAILEAMAAGKAVVASAIEGVDEAVTHGETALLTPPGDSVMLATAIRLLLVDPALRQRLAAAGQARVRRHFSSQVMVERTMQLYDQLLFTRKQTLDCEVRHVAS